MIRGTDVEEDQNPMDDAQLMAAIFLGHAEIGDDASENQSVERFQPGKEVGALLPWVRWILAFTSRRA
jgi:hypothetical protein